METIRVNVTQDNSVGVQMEYTTNYNKLTNKPSINGVTLTGNKTTSDLGIVTGGESWELINTCIISQDDPQNSVEFLKDSNGNDFSLSKFRLVYTLNTGANDNTGIVRVNDLPSNRNIGSSLYVNSYYGSIDRSCVFEIVESIDKIGSVSFNAYSTGTVWKNSQSQIWGLDDYKHYAPYYYVQTQWTTATYGKVELWGIRYNESN